MRGSRRLALGAGAFLIVAILASGTFAATTIPSVLTGGFNMAGGYSNTPGMENYFTGTTATGPQAIPSAPDPVVSAKVKLQLPAVPFPEGGFYPGYVSDDPSETVTLFDAPPAMILATPKTTPEAIGVWADLGSGLMYDSEVVTAAMAGTDIEFDLPLPAIGLINASYGGFFTVGAALTTLDGSSADEIVFAYSDLAAPHMAGLKPRLELTYLPEPSGVMLLGVAALAALRRRRA